VTRHVSDDRAERTEPCFLESRAALAGKVALVAGGGGGLGRAVALDFARAGLDLALCDRDAAALDRTVEEARNLGARVTHASLDVRDSRSLTGFFDVTDGERGRLDVLVNVVGGTFKSPFTEVSSKGVDTLIRTNFTWLTECTRLAAMRMADSGRGGSIITITSIEAHRAAPGYAVYAAMKSAVAHLSRTLAVELGPSGIRVNCIAPDIVPTAGMLGLMGDATSGTSEPGSPALSGSSNDPLDEVQIPMGRKGRETDVGNCALFLASDLSSYITGTTLHPDGGALASSGWLRWPEAGWTARPPSWASEDLQGRG
jgi:3-oxoacyl-[acyl-carrier protein] reductase